MDLGLICACSLSVGSHYGQYVLGPLRSSLVTSIGLTESDFAMVLTASAIVNTVTPLVGFLIPKFGAGRAGIFATGIVAVGQALVLVGILRASVSLMVAGQLIFGLGISPLAVVQESIVLSQTRDAHKSKAVAAALLLGKLFSWMGSISAVPLSNIAPSLPFFTSLALSLFSLSVAVFYRKLEKREPTAAPSDHSKFSTPGGLLQFGDLFWCYALLCIFCGSTWFPFLHYSTAMLEHFFDISTTVASTTASSITFMAIILYPVVGSTIDIGPKECIYWLFALSSVLTCTSILFLHSEAWRTWLGHIGCTIPFAVGYGYVPLVLVIAASRVVKQEDVPIALSVHKSLEMAGQSIMQSIAGLVLQGGQEPAFTHLLSWFAGSNILHLCIVFFFWHTSLQRIESPEYSYALLTAKETDELNEEVVSTKAKVKWWHKVAMSFSVAAVLTAWVMFAIDIWS